METGTAPAPAEEHAEALGRLEGKLFCAWAAREVRVEDRSSPGFAGRFWLDVARSAPFSVRLGPATYHPTPTPPRSEPFGSRVSSLLDEIQALAEVPVSDAPAERLRAGLVRAVTGRLNQTLRERPQEHGDVVHQIRRRGLEGAVPFPALNDGLARDLAILYAFVPYADTSALVSARRIREREVLLDVVSNSLQGLRKRDWSGRRIAHEFLDQMFEVSSESAVFEWAGIVEFCRQGIEQIERWQAAKGTYRSVYSRTMQPGSHFLAALYKIRHPEVPWIAEFSDPQLYNAYGQERVNRVARDALFRELAAGVRRAGYSLPRDITGPMLVELLGYALADEIVFTNENQLEFMLGYLRDRSLEPRVRERARVAHHPTLPPEFYEVVPSDHQVDPDRVNLAYFGVFYATRGLTEVLEALQGLPPDVRSRVRLHIFTDRPHRMSRQVEDYGLQDVIAVNRYVPFLEYLNVTTKMDVLIVNDATTAHVYDTNPFLPSKWADYRGSGRDVWSIVEDGSVLSTMKTAYRSEIGDVAQAREEILRMVLDRFSDGGQGLQH
jgi:hypothetical protein